MRAMKSTSTRCDYRKALSARNYSQVASMTLDRVDLLYPQCVIVHKLRSDSASYMIVAQIFLAVHLITWCQDITLMTGKTQFKQYWQQKSTSPYKSLAVLFKIQCFITILLNRKRVFQIIIINQIVVFQKAESMREMYLLDFHLT